MQYPEQLSLHIYINALTRQGAFIPRSVFPGKVILGCVVLGTGVSVYDLCCSPNVILNYMRWRMLR